jgi:FAD/FMN-containing dehydrogenase
MNYSTSIHWLVSLLISSTALASNDLQQVLSVLKPQLSKEAIVTFPWDSHWQDFQVTASTPRLSPHYSVVIEVASESDVQATVRMASRFSIPFLAISGGHAWTDTLKTFPYGIQINMRRLNTTVLSENGSTAFVGGGMLQHELTRSLFAKKKYAGEHASLSPHECYHLTANLLSDRLV